MKLADSGHEGEIDILVESDWYWELVASKVKVGNSGEPVTKFGFKLNLVWFLMGQIHIIKGIYLASLSLVVHPSTPCLGLTILMRENSN